MQGSFALNHHSAYQELPPAPDDVRGEQCSPPAGYYQSLSNSTVHHPQDSQSGAAPLIPKQSWGSKASKAAVRVGSIEPGTSHGNLGPSSSAATPSWLPYALRWPCLVLILAFSAVLEILVVALHVTSARNLGLVADDGSGSIIAVLKFGPTLLAVAHGILLSILLNDVRRTQALASLASPSGASAEHSLVWTADAWWECLTASLPKRGARKTSWPMLCATVAFMLSFIVVSPFSSTLLVSQDVRFIEEVAFSQLDIAPALPLRADPMSTTYFRTVSNILLNATTSAWITDSYAVLPFWPSTMDRSPLGPMLSDSEQTWSAKTTVFHVEMDCEQMNLVESRQVDWLEHQFNTTVQSYKFKLLSRSGCAVDMTLPFEADLSVSGGAVWSTPRNLDSIDFSLRNPYSVTGCSQDEIILLSNSLRYATATNATVVGQACNTNYYMGDSTVTVVLGKGGSLVEINQGEFLSTRKPIPSTLADVSSYQDVFLNHTDWTIHLKSPVKSQRAFAWGPAILLSAMYNFSPEQMIADPSVIQNLERVKRRFFGEQLRDVFDAVSGGDTSKVVGTIVDVRRRMIVVPSVAIISEVSLGVQILLLSIAFITTRLSWRPLGLFVDPAPPIRIAKLISGEAGTLQSLYNLHDASSKGLARSLSNEKYMLSGGHIHRITSDIIDGPVKMSSPQQKQQPNQRSLLDPARPEKQSHAFSIWIFTFLVVLLSATLTMIAYLYWYSDAIGLYQTTFVYAFDISVGGLDLGEVNPASLITTIVAVSIGLWWGSLETTLRRIQPYLVLANEPINRTGSEGVSISYISSYLLWAAWRAVKRSHWVLALVCTGAFLSEILTIAMSSLWVKEAGTLPSLTEVQRQLELRHTPQLSAGNQQFTSHAGNYKQNLLSDLFDDMKTSWIYGAAVQTSLNGSEQPWSSEGWSFIPYDLSLVPSVKLQNTGKGPAASRNSINVTVDTSAIRARLECSPHEHLNLDDSKTWLTEWDLRNTTQWHKEASTKALPRGFELGLSEMGDNTLLYLDQQPDDQGSYTTFFVNNKRFQCCQNKVNEQLVPGSVGYWSPNLLNGSYYPDFAKTWPANFTVKWVHGLPVEGYCGKIPVYGCFPRLLWAEKPRMAALNCMPIIETADATVTVDATNGRVVDFVLRSEPRPDDHAWSNNFEQHQYNSSEPGFAINITTSYGILFLTGLLGAADLDAVQGTDLNYLYTYSENIEDQAFNIRIPGLNVDLMTYSMLSLVNYDHEALLDLETLKRTAQQTFTALFQGYASNNVSITTGGYVFQSPGETLPDDLDGPANKSSEETRAVPIGGTVIMHVSHSVELLKISELAAWICLSILAYLIIVGVTLTIASRGYTVVLLRRISSIADVAVLMAGSHRLLNLAWEKAAVRKFRLDSNTRVWLGWFNDINGIRRWGIEVTGIEDVGEENATTALLNGDATQLNRESSIGTMITASSSIPPEYQPDVSLGFSIGYQTDGYPGQEPGHIRYRGHTTDQQGIGAHETRLSMMPMGAHADPEFPPWTAAPANTYFIGRGVEEPLFEDGGRDDIYLRPLNSERDLLMQR